MFSVAYHTILYNPLLNALIVLYNTIAFHDLGVAIILLTIIVRIILFPIFHKTIKYQVAMQAMQPKLKKLEETHKKNSEEHVRAIAALHQEHGISPFGALLPIIQLPILIALYQIFLESLTPTRLQGIYSFVVPPTQINTLFLGLINLENSSMVIVALVALAQYVQGSMSLPKVQAGHALSAQERIARQMAFMSPIILVVVFVWFDISSAVGLYLLTTSLFSILQQYFLQKKSSHGTLEPLHS